ncbi:MAG TPA: 2-amino-4-hydroxy-6-hydroxymethyldihydropteridine diphosphokinase, partial [Flavitalea sp.]|nr:2-amino-4-hydroxy-6-hydroxymethyldihydropteridine diphosphokinase [Flavitalea sp.]
MNKAYLLMGGNIGDTLSSLKQSIDILANTYGTILQQSRIYKTAPWGKTDQQDFLNQAVLLTTSLTANELLTALLQIEEQMGRRRFEKYGPRVIDIDILLFNDFVIK